MIHAGRRLPWLLLILTATAAADDWPSHRHDAQRSGRTSETLAVEKLQQQWVMQSPQAPRPAWPGPAKWDAYAHIRGLRSMRDYDAAFHVTVVDQSLFYGSSADDAVHCIDTRTGTERWSFITDGPVRIAPTISNGRVYFGSDDGHAYCVDAKSGKQLWKSVPAQAEQQILNNGRFISHWPCRTGVLVADGTAYFGLSLLPWRQSYLVAVDAETGKANGDGRFARTLVNQTLEGGFLLQGDALIALRGRVGPFLFNRKDGSDIGEVKEGGGGVFATLNANGDLLHGPGNKTGWIAQSSLQTRKTMKKFDGRIGVVSMQEGNLFLSDDAVTAVHGTGKVSWETPRSKPTHIVVAGEVAFVGGDGEVSALRLTDGKEVWRETVNGRVFGLAVADGRLFVSTDEGAICCFAAGTSRVRRPIANKETVRPLSSKPVPSASTNDQNSQKGLLGQWTFHSGMSDQAKRRGLSTPERRVQSSAGSLSGVISGNLQLREVGGVEALELDGRSNSILITDELQKVRLPTEAITAEAWVRIDTPVRWGGIVGAMQDNGSFERGWVLGYQDSKFSFGVAATDGPDKLNYLTSQSSFEPQLWYHVVGTYDSMTQKLFVNGKLEASSTSQQGPIHYPETAFFEMGAYHDKDENIRMTGMLHEVLVYRRTLSEAEIQASHKAKRGKFSVPIRLASGPFAAFSTPTDAIIKWRTSNPSPTILELTGHGKKQRLSDPTLKLNHTANLSNLSRSRVGQYVIKTEMEGVKGTTQQFELDSSFNYSQVPVSGEPVFKTDQAQVSAMAKRILGETKINNGICLVLGIRDASLAFELARQSDLNIVCVDTDPERIESARRALSNAKAYGTRLSVKHIQSYAKLPFIRRCANLVISERQLLDGELVIDAKEAYRVLRPFGGVAQFEWGQDTDAESAREWLSAATQNFRIGNQDNRVTATVVGPATEGAGEWSHLYGRADNSAFGGETLAGASTVDELEVQWLGRPGPRAQPDRSGRKPAPLSKNGRLFVQGLHRLIGVDALNGTPLWSLEIPSLERFNMPRDCGNWCADNDHLFVAVRDGCWRIDAQTGDVEQIHDVIDGDRTEWQYDWGYVARVGNVLLGSAVKQGTAFTNFWGNADAGWYDARSGSTTFKVCSENLFAVDPDSGKQKWIYTNGLIINPTITATAEYTYFIECRNPAVKASTPRRVGMPELWKDQHLVALHTATGEIAWETTLDTEDGIVVFNMAKGGDRLVLSSSNDKKYNVYAFSANDGKQVWEQSFGWLGGKGDHGKAMSRPAIVGDTVYVRPQTLDLKTGEVGSLTMPGGGCGTYAATTEALFFRSGNVTAWNRSSGSTTSWNRLRPGCWLSTIPANGMLLSPEAGGGCSCGSWLETSVGFMPKRD